MVLVSCTYVGLYTTVVPVIHTSGWFTAIFSNQAILNVEWTKRDTSVPIYSRVDVVAAIQRCLSFCNLKKTKMARVLCLHFHPHPVISKLLSNLLCIDVTFTLNKFILLFSFVAPSFSVMDQNFKLALSLPDQYFCCFQLRQMLLVLTDLLIHVISLILFFFHTDHHHHITQILLPVLHRHHWSVYCVNLDQSRIDVLDSRDYSSEGDAS